MNRQELVDWVAWQIHKSKNVRRDTLDALSSLEFGTGPAAEAAKRVPDGGPAFQKFLRDVEARVKEINSDRKGWW
jgi:hypothetical protein